MRTPVLKRDELLFPGAFGSIYHQPALYLCMFTYTGPSVRFARGEKVHSIRGSCVCVSD